MVSLAAVHTSNAGLSARLPSTVTAVFAGATRGIGRATLFAFAKHVPHGHAIIVGRSASSFSDDLASLRQVNAESKFTFIEGDVSLLSSIDAISSEIRDIASGSNQNIDLVFTSQGYISFNGREQNADGLDNSTSLRYYGRMRLISNLFPVMSADARSISILAGGQEGKIFEDDLDLVKNYGVANAANQFASMTTLTFDQFAQQHMDMGFVHVFPGLVSTGLLGRSATGVLGVFLRYVVEPMLGLFVAAKPQDAGERMLAYATVPEYAHGSWSLDWDGTAKEVEVIKGYRQRGLAETVVKHNEEMFRRALDGPQ